MIFIFARESCKYAEFFDWISRFWELEIMLIKRKKRDIVLLICLLAALLAGCGSALAAGNGSGNASSETADGKIKVVTMIYPEYDWVMEIIGGEADRFQVTCLTASGVDLHSYQPSVGDMTKISESDLFLYIGGESDSWAVDATETMVNPENRSLGLMELLGDGLKEEEIVEGMEAEEEDEDEVESGEPEYDEHVWLSLSNAKIFVNAITETLADVDPEHAETYRTNRDAYLQKLEDLDARYREMIAGAAKDTVLFGDRFPFRYLVDDYGLKYYAAFVGCSAETEASFETIVFLANKLDELDLSYVMVIENSDRSLAQTIIDSSRNRDRQIAQLNSLQSVTADDIAAGVTYLSVMEENLEVLRSVLN
jgi:zinc transport system substrate-binding protein